MESRLQKTPKILFLADVHLRQKEKAEHFAQYLYSLKGSYTHLYILGDLFDYWLGKKSERFDEFQSVLNTLKQLTSSGMKVFFLHGNRDFLIDSSFTQRYGVEIHSNFQQILLPDCRILLTHGDLLCTSDHKYQVYRTIIRSPILKLLATLLPTWFTHQMALKLKKTSKKSIAKKQIRHLTVSLDYVKHLLFHWDFDVLICGHVHQERYFCLANNPKKKFMILGGWEETGSVIEYNQGEFRFLQPHWNSQKSERKAINLY